MWNLIKKPAFKVDAEQMHEWAVKLISMMGNRSPKLLETLTQSGSIAVSSGPGFEFFGKSLKTPVGLAAGFDKNAVLLPHLPHMGFSFAEIGSVTLRAQPGNPKPRLFRGEESLFNFMGFNNDGAEVVAKRLSEYKLPQNFAVGINLGLNKDTAHSDAATEYAQTFAYLKPFGDYFVVNISSPNTQDLRNLQTLEHVENIFNAIKRNSSNKKIFLKLSPELDQNVMEEIFEYAYRMGIDGFVLTNTLKGERGDKSGGWSGRPLTELSLNALKFARPKTTLPLVSVGGIMSVEDALARKHAGADLIQIYTSWVFRGPTFPAELSKAWLKDPA